ncbi:MAG: hypothetical protein WB628_13045 [Candidatus Sulfotelmatobacter sp.]
MVLEHVFHRPAFMVTEAAASCQDAVFSSKVGADLWPQEVNQQRSADREANAAMQEVSSEAIDQISQNLSCDNGDAQSPSPELAAKPAHSSQRQDRGQYQEGNSDQLARRRKLLPGARVEYLAKST